MDWRIKGAIQKVLGYVPGGQRIHHQLRRRVGGLADFGRECDLAVDDWRLMMGHLGAANVAVPGATVVELGTGLYPTFALCLYLAGVARVYTLDRERQLEPDLLRALVDRLTLHVALIARVTASPAADVERKLAAIAAALDRGALLSVATDNVVDYRAPASAADTALPADSVDLVVSNSVLEHLPPRALELAFAEARRILRPGGVMFHSVHCGDHYAHLDRSIHQLHYLRYSEAEWKKWNNAFLYQNRLRAHDFLELARHAGFTIEVDTSRPSKQHLAQLDGLQVDPAFARYTREQLAITSIDFVARKPA